MTVPAAGRKRTPAKKVPGSGRKKGSLNKVTAEIKGLAQQHGADAIQTLAILMQQADSDTARIAAAKELLDRGYGKARQTIDTTIKRSVADMSDEDLATLAGIEHGTSEQR